MRNTIEGNETIREIIGNMENNRYKTFYLDNIKFAIKFIDKNEKGN